MDRKERGGGSSSNSNRRGSRSQVRVVKRKTPLVLDAHTHQTVSEILNGPTQNAHDKDTETDSEKYVSSGNSVSSVSTQSSSSSSSESEHLYSTSCTSL